jgi:hypothetical protein
MRFLILPVFIFLLSFKVFSAIDSTQNDNEQTIFGGVIKNGGYGGLEVKFSQVNSKDKSMGIWVGGRGGWIINSVFSIGGGGWGLVTHHKIWEKNDTSYYVNCGYGGLFLEYINSSNNLVHFTINSLIGAGGLSYSQRRNSFTNDLNNEDWNIMGQSFMVIEPGITADLNVFKWFRISAGASYRSILFLDFNHTFSDGAIGKTTGSDLSGFNFNLMFKFGKF